MNFSMLLGLHLVTIPRFTPEDYVKALQAYRPTALFVVPSLLLFLASHPAVTKKHLSSVRTVTSGAAPATEGLLQKFREKLGRDDVLVRQGYGMTESSPVTLMMPKLTPPSKVNTCGVLYPGTEGKIVSLSTNEIQGPHKSGELLVRGPQVSLGVSSNWWTRRGWCFCLGDGGVLEQRESDEGDAGRRWLVAYGGCRLLRRGPLLLYCRPMQGVDQSEGKPGTCATF